MFFLNNIIRILFLKILLFHPNYYNNLKFFEKKLLCTKITTNLKIFFKKYYFGNNKYSFFSKILILNNKGT